MSTHNRTVQKEDDFIINVRLSVLNKPEEIRFHEIFNYESCILNFLNLDKINYK